jgi:hypothetical protein
MVPDLVFKSRITGIDPIISIMEKRMIVTEAISLKFSIFFGKNRYKILRGRRDQEYLPIK